MEPGEPREGRRDFGRALNVINGFGEPQKISGKKKRIKR